MIIIML